MSGNGTRLSPLLTDFGTNRSDILVSEYNVPAKNVRQTLLMKYGLISFPRWAFAVIGVAAFVILTVLCGIILNAALAQAVRSATFGQTCSKNIKCLSSLGLTCGSESKCTCQNNFYWYQKACVQKRFYTESCNQTGECQTDLGLICSPLDGLCQCPNWTRARTCDCPSTHFWTGSKCQNRSTYLGSCSSAGVNYQCLWNSNLICNGVQCECTPGAEYWNGTSNRCFTYDTYRSPCNVATSSSCDPDASLYCLPAGSGSQCPLSANTSAYTCECLNGTYWSGGACVSKKLYNSSCFWDCECDTNTGLKCMNRTCSCPAQVYWSPSSQRCLIQLNYTQQTCQSNSECDQRQGLTCYLSGTACNCPGISTIGMCDCALGQFYDTNSSSCQSGRSYNEFCTSNYMCDTTLGLFCQVSSSVVNCSCPDTSRQYMCDCNATSYWNGIACVSRSPANDSCSYNYQCQSPLVCITNETDNGIFSDICRCPLGSYYVNGAGCVPSIPYLGPCVGSSQCDEREKLFCRYNLTRTTCFYDRGASLPGCDCSDNQYYYSGNSSCVPLGQFNQSCTEDCECVAPFVCNSSRCGCANFYSSLNQSCVTYLSYNDSCQTDAECAATPNLGMSCVSGSCRCNSSSLWNGTYCSTAINFRSSCIDNSGCLGGLICRQMSCTSVSRSCGCPNETFYYASNQTCLPCPLSANEYVVRYPAKDLCVRALNPTTASFSTFASARSTCSALTSIGSYTPALISVHNQSELDCIAASLRGQHNTILCAPTGLNRYQYYLGYDTTTSRFLDGTRDIIAFPSFSWSTLTTSDCLTYCSNSASSGIMQTNVCNGTVTTGGLTYYIGYLCDYRAND